MKSFKILLRFAPNKVVLDIYYKKVCVRVASRVAKRLKA